MENMIRLAQVRTQTPMTPMEKLANPFFALPLPFLIAAAVSAGLTWMGVPMLLVTLIGIAMLVFAIALVGKAYTHERRVREKWRAEIEKLGLAQLEAVARSDRLAGTERREIESLLEKRREELPVPLAMAQPSASRGEK